MRKRIGRTRKLKRKNYKVFTKTRYKYVKAVSLEIAREKFKKKNKDHIICIIDCTEIELNERRILPEDRGK